MNSKTKTFSILNSIFYVLLSWAVGEEKDGPLSGLSYSNPSFRGLTIRKRRMQCAHAARQSARYGSLEPSTLDIPRPEARVQDIMDIGYGNGQHKCI